MIGLYLRLSMADGDLGSDGKDESNSIENQRGLLYDFVLRRDDVNGEVKEYIDDGYSGTNFDRPAFKELMEDMKAGKIDTLITKDLSRLGRNYIDVGDYMEQIFPLLGVRYIAINSNYDSNEYIGNTVGLEMSVMNLVNALYSKDLSKKVKSAYRAKWKTGHSTSGRPPFGYIRDPEDKSQWLIEPVAAEIVKRIFRMAAEGSSGKDIVNALNADHILTPGQYREKYGFMKRVNRKVSDDEWMWEYRMVWKILKTYEYTGALIQGKVTNLAVGSKVIRKTSEQERIVYEGHHEPLVSRDEYYKALSIVNRRKQSGAINHDDYPLGPLVYCGNCGLLMDHPDTLERYFVCKHKSAAGAHSKCSDTRYPADKIEQLVRKSLRDQLLKMQQLSGELKEHREAAVSAGANIDKLRQKIKSLKSKKTMLYESYADGKLEKDDYLKQRDIVKDQLDILIEKENRWVSENEATVPLTTEADIYIRLARNLYSASEITRDITDSFIERITIHDEEHVEIKFKFADLIRDMTRVIEEQKTREEGSEC